MEAVTVVFLLLAFPFEGVAKRDSGACKAKAEWASVGSIDGTLSPEAELLSRQQQQLRVNCSTKKFYGLPMRPAIDPTSVEKTELNEQCGVVTTFGVGDSKFRYWLVNSSDPSDLEELGDVVMWKGFGAGNRVAYLAHVQVFVTGRGTCKPLVYNAITEFEIKGNKMFSLALNFVARQNPRSACFCYRKAATLLTFHTFSIRGEMVDESVSNMDLCDGAGKKTDEDLYNKLRGDWLWGARSNFIHQAADESSAMKGIVLADIRLLAVSLLALAK